MADITRDQFDEDLLVQKKYFQQNKLLLDDEANVIQDIWRYRIGRILSELVESQDVRFGDGFSVVDHANDNTVTVKAGAIAVRLDDTKSSVRRELIWMDADVNLDSFTTPSGSDRTDYVYLDITEEEVDPSGDPNIINPAYGSETTRDLRLSWSIEISQGSGEGSPPAGHWYRRLAVIQRTNGVAQIQPEDITNVLPDVFFRRELLYSQFVQADFGVADQPADWADSDVNCWVNYESGTDAKVKLIFPYLKHRHCKRIVAEFEARKETGAGGGQGKVKLDIEGVGSDETEGVITHTSWEWYSLIVDVSGMTDGDFMKIVMSLRSTIAGEGNGCWVRKTNIWAEY